MTLEELALLPGIPAELVRAAYMAAPGNEIESGKFASPESSAALVANTFGLFLDRPHLLPPLPGTRPPDWPAKSVGLEAIVRFPWSGGRHPCLDVMIVTGGALIGVESKRYEPFRAKAKAELSEAYWRPVWGDAMRGYENVRDGLRDGMLQFSRLDAAQLVKHAFGLRTAVHADAHHAGKRPVLFYLYAEPKFWPDGRAAAAGYFEHHREEIRTFTSIVEESEVIFISCSYRDLLAAWSSSSNETVRDHASAVAARFSV